MHLRPLLQEAVTVCPVDQAACMGGRLEFIAACLPDGLGMAQYQIWQFNLDGYRDPEDLFDALADQLRDDDHATHHYAGLLLGAEDLRGYLRRALHNTAASVARARQRERRQRREDAERARRLVIVRQPRAPEDDVGAAMPDDVNQPPGDVPHADQPLPEAPHGEQQLAADATAMVVAQLRQHCSPRNRLIVYACGRQGQHAEPFPISADQLDAQEQQYLADHAINGYADLLGHPDENRLAVVAAMFGMSEVNVRQQKSLAWGAVKSDTIERACAIPTLRLTPDMLVALILSRPGEVPPCLAEGRHAQNLDPELAARWDMVHFALVSPPPHWEQIGILERRIKAMDTRGRRQFSKVVLEVD
jgi:hypothetical protein